MDEAKGRNDRDCVRDARQVARGMVGWVKEYVRMRRMTKWIVTRVVVFDGRFRK